MTKIVFAAGHVKGAKIWLGYNEDQSMFDLATREAKYAAEVYGQETKTFLVTNTSYPAVQAACTGYDLAVFEHSNAEAAPVKGTANRVTVYRTVKNPGDGVCLIIAQVTAKILNTIAYPVAHAANSSGNDAYGVLGRAMLAGCKDAWLAENGFHTHPATRQVLSDPNVRQQIAEAKVDAMATYYGWTKIQEDDMLEYGDKGQPVVEWQNWLIRWDANALPKFKADGDFGNETLEWTNKFKAFVGMVQDGKVDDLTWSSMVADISDDSDAQIAILQAELATQKAKTDQALAANAILQDANEGLKTQVDLQAEELADAAGDIRNLLDFSQKH